MQRLQQFAKIVLQLSGVFTSVSDPMCWCARGVYARVRDICEVTFCERVVSVVCVHAVCVHLVCVHGGVFVGELL